MQQDPEEHLATHIIEVKDDSFLSISSTAARISFISARQEFFCCSVLSEQNSIIIAVNLLLHNLHNSVAIDYNIWKEIGYENRLYRFHSITHQLLFFHQIKKIWMVLDNVMGLAKNLLLWKIHKVYDVQSY